MIKNIALKILIYNEDIFFLCVINQLYFLFYLHHFGIKKSFFFDVKKLDFSINYINKKIHL